MLEKWWWNRVHLGSTCVMVIDMQEHWVNKLSNRKATSMIQEQVAVIEAGARRRMPILMVELKPREFGRTVPELRQAAEAAAERSYVEYFTKEHDDAFTNGELGEAITRHRRDQIVLMGLNADYCVKATAESAIERGYRILTSRKVLGQATDYRPDIGWYRDNTVLKWSLSSVLAT